MTAPPPDFDLIEARDVSKLFGRRRALSRVQLTCRAGEIVGLLGPNGAGKSTLLSICSTLMRPTSGEVLYGDRPARLLGDRLRARIGVLGHDLFLYGELSARENLEFFGRLYGIADAAARASRALAGARLDDRRDDRVAAFSRGLRQRLALERALLHAPRLVLLDEPFTGLDDASTALLVERLKGLRSQGAIVLMATHDFDTAAEVVDRAVCLERGRLLPVPSGPAPLRARYREVLREVPV
ncbi:MAG TPA: ATP-binding cassette domain-containing protein [Vicinamibacterales bacterium]|nr:ATP-binding cassette domain-containing protein [Vicinamibacterales bacterium]